jgi:VanZ family protein
MLKTTLGAACLALLAGILVVGLWPFGSPRNGVSWMENGSGLRFHGYGTALGAAPLRASGSGDAACSIEIWFRPEGVGSHTIFSIHAPDAPRKFAFRQSHSDLVLTNAAGRSVFEVDGVFEPGKALHLIVTSGLHGTALYADGKRLSQTARARYTMEDLAGTLILSGLTRYHDAWPGEIHGLAIYNEELGEAEILDHFEDRTVRARPAGSAVALFSFEERGGALVHNQAVGQAGLSIPENFTVLQQLLFQPPWEDFRMNWSFWKDVIINVCGFAPFGAFVRTYLATVRKVSWSLAFTILAGAMTSLTIEVLQSHLPTRDSSATDVLTNIAGTWMGASLFGSRWWMA